VGQRQTRREERCGKVGAKSFVAIL
jgi:hypothetical protein